MAGPEFGTVAIVGVGLIGGSIGLALRRGGSARRVLGVGRDESGLDEARRLGAIDRGTTDLARASAEADAVVVCTPVGRIAADAVAAAAAAPVGTLITDAGSTKRMIVEAVERDPAGRLAFVGGHPIAGSELKGVRHARADLFDGRTCVLTPTAITPADRLRRARNFWAATGASLLEMDPQRHDDALARTSHLPHAVAAALAAAVPEALLPLAAGAYRDGTRVAGADPALWAGILLANRAAVLESLDEFAGQLAVLRRHLLDDDEAAIRDWWQVARDRRAGFNDSQPSRH